MSSVKFWGNWIHPGNCAVGDINIILAKASSCYHNVWIRLWITMCMYMYMCLATWPLNLVFVCAGRLLVESCRGDLLWRLKHGLD